MFTITEEQYREISSLISKHCCPCISKNWHCAEAECDVQMLCEILWAHVDRNDIKSDEEKTAIEWPEDEDGNNCNEDELPFKK